ncbi:hypothetical protein [Streptomyces sp. NBC_01622]|uniref:hypothetical protein n=1 Tax=Streptomyces sp. NBC_01622 TaxID=2975903 RepID=UPI00386D6AE2
MITFASLAWTDAWGFRREGWLWQGDQNWRRLLRFKENLQLVVLALRGAVLSWAIEVTDEYAEWFRQMIKQDLGSATQVAQAVAALRETGPTLGRPLVDRLK